MSNEGFYGLYFNLIFLRPTKPNIQWVLGPLSPGIKLPEREADYSSSSSADLKNIGAITVFPYTPSWRGA
jgi:hypothetical protein